MKKIFTFLFLLLFTLTLGFDFSACDKEPTGNQYLHGTWYVNEVLIDRERYSLGDYDVMLGDYDYPLTADSFEFVFYEDGKVELNSVHYSTITGKLTSFERTGGCLGGNCEFSFTLGDKKFEGDIYQPLMMEGSMRIWEEGSNEGTFAYLEYDVRGYLTYEEWLQKINEEPQHLKAYIGGSELGVLWEPETVLSFIEIELGAFEYQATFEVTITQKQYVFILISNEINVYAIKAENGVELINNGLSVIGFPVIINDTQYNQYRTEIMMEPGTYSYTISFNK